MKYIIATALVVLALVTVFDAHKLIPIPRAVGSIVNGSLSKHLPFGAKVAYAESCMADLNRERDQVRYAVSDASVRLRILDGRIETLKRRQSECRTAIRDLVDMGESTAPDSLARTVERYDHLLAEIDRLHHLRNRLADTASSLELAETQVSADLRELDNRLKIVAIDHEHNDARELASQLAGTSSYPDQFNRARQCADLLDTLEHRERIREDLHSRYGYESIDLMQRPNPAERAREILAGDC
ncbi:hypothetical protein PDESU_02249 [Pontiella desulfatans]|uniref:Chromosome partition protein Smc n=1 Tax=Pontiella desulfatans TaxID=2750659 RepID=A0A6C2U170_PONDE|nr:hypothetical protein [Pontiella desulfatans]VGO13692.1 hypothetical protein PDESU_02249 [Pontiella desulfatans]